MGFIWYPLFFVLWALSIPLSIGFVVLTWILCVPLAMTADENGNLPKYLSWFQTFDATLDAGWKDNYDGYNPNSPLWWNRAKWLARNPGYSFDYYPLGIAWVQSDWKCLVFTETDTTTVFFAVDGKHFNFLFDNGYLKLKCGHKAWNLFDNPTKTFMPGPWGPAMRIPFCFSIMIRFSR